MAFNIRKRESVPETPPCCEPVSDSKVVATQSWVSKLFDKIWAW